MPRACCLWNIARLAVNPVIGQQRERPGFDSFQRPPKIYAGH